VLGRAHHRIDVYLEGSMLGQPFELPVEYLQAFLGYIVGLDIVDADLEMIKPSPIQPLDSLRREQVAVGDQGCDAAPSSNVANQLVEFWVKQRLAAADRDHGRAQLGQAVHATQHGGERNRFGEVVIFVAVGTRQVAPTNGHDVRDDWVSPRLHRLRNHLGLPQLQVIAVYLASDGKHLGDVYGERIRRKPQPCIP